MNQHVAHIAEHMERVQGSFDRHSRVLTETMSQMRDDLSLVNHRFSDHVEDSVKSRLSVADRLARIERKMQSSDRYKRVTEEVSIGVTSKRNL